jgi:hypothetical protein
VAAADTTTVETTLRRITLGERADVVFLLRDYFRRSGVAAEIATPTVVELTTDAPQAALEQLLADWVRVLGVPAQFVEVAAPAENAAAPLAPASLEPAAKPTPRLGSLLTAKGFISEEQLTWALNESRETREMLGALLLRKGWIFEEELARTLSEQLAIPYVSVGRIGVNPEVARLVPREVGETVAAIPVRAGTNRVQVAFADPTDPEAIEAIRAYIEHVQPAVAEFSDIRLAWRAVEQPQAHLRRIA